MTLKEFLLNNPERQYGHYSETAKKFDVSYEQVRSLARRLRREPTITKQKNEVFNIAQDSLIQEFMEWKRSRTSTSVKKIVKKLPKPYTGGDPANVLVVGDLHAPFILEGYLEFCREQQERFNCGTVVMIGDLIDNHAISYHESDPDGHSAGAELIKAKEQLEDWYEVFPITKVCIGNHDKLPYRKAYTFGMPSAWMRSYADVLGTPKEWEWDFHHILNDVFYTHGTGVSGDAGAMKIAAQNRQSAVIGHLHSIANIKHSASYKDRIFAMTVGCGLDHKAYAFSYGKDMINKPIISCGVVLEGKVPILIPMEL